MKNNETVKKQLNIVLKRTAFFAAYVLAIVFLWNGVYAIVENEYVFPSFIQVLAEMKALFLEKEFYISFWKSFLRVINAFSVSFIAAAVVAIFARIFPIVEKIFEPLISAMRALPTMAIMLILLIWSTPSKAPVIIAFLALFPVLYTGFLSAFSLVNKELVEMNKVFRVSKKKQIFQMYLPMALPNILREASGGIAFALKLVVSAEILANTYISIGGMLQLSKIYLQTPKVFALTLIVILVGVFLEIIGIVLSRFIERRVR